MKLINLTEKYSIIEFTGDKMGTKKNRRRKKVQFQNVKVIIKNSRQIKHFPKKLKVKPTKVPYTHPGPHNKAFSEQRSNVPTDIYAINRKQWLKDHYTTESEYKRHKRRMRRIFKDTDRTDTHWTDYF